MKESGDEEGDGGQVKRDGADILNVTIIPSSACVNCCSIVVNIMGGNVYRLTLR